MTLVIESKAYIVPDRSRYAAILPPNQFTPERVEDVTGILNGHREYILAGMREAAPPREKALVGQIYDGDADRVSGCIR